MWWMRIVGFQFAVILICVVGPTPTRAQSVPSKFQWVVKKVAWSEGDERRFEEFVTIIGEAVAARKCHTVNECLNGSVNHPYRATNPRGMSFEADCADFPYYLRAYFAWKNNLPFGYVRNVSPRPPGSGDPKNSVNGNYAAGYRSFVPPNERSPTDIRAALKAINDNVHSGHFRVLFRPGDPRVPDLYPITINRTSIRPGTTIYNAAGHVGVVYKVLANGRVFFIDAHPKSLVTHGTYGPTFPHGSRPYHAPGFKNFRSLKLENARRIGRAYVGGTLTVSRDADLSDYSLEQYVGNVDPIPDVDDKTDAWKTRRFRLNPNALPNLSFYDFVRARVAGANLRYDPKVETEEIIRQMCGDIGLRGGAIRAALTNGIQSRSQPDNLPDNIYQTSGEWEDFATPSRDARTRVLFVHLRDEVARYLKMFRVRDPALDYSGNDLAGDLWKIYLEKTVACKIPYQTSNGSSKVLNLYEVTERLFKLGFDPYHCVERRWGATASAELMSCPEREPGEIKSQWFEAEQRLRHEVVIDPAIPMGFDLATLRAKGPGTGTDVVPDVDVRRALGM